MGSILVSYQYSICDTIEFIFVSEFELFVGKGSALVTHSTGEMVELQDLFPQFELLVGMGSILVSCSTGCESLFPEFELFLKMGSILVSLSTGCGVDFRVYFQNLNFLWGWVRSSSAVPLAIWSNSRLSLRLEDLGI